MRIIIELKEKERFGFLNLRSRNRIEIHEIMKDESWLVDDDALRIMKRVAMMSANRISQIVYPFENIVKFYIEE